MNILPCAECVVDEDDDFIEIPPCTPGIAIQGYRYREDLTQKQLSRLAGIPIKRLSAMENDKIPVDEATARRLAEVLNTEPCMFLERAGE